MKTSSTPDWKFILTGLLAVTFIAQADPLLTSWYTANGGKYAHSTVLEKLGIPAPDQTVMSKPGFKVMHQAFVDTHSTCLTFVLCLREVKTWSDVHPGHVPMMIDVEMKDSDAEVTPATFDALDAEIRSVLTPNDLITPDDVRGADPSLGHAVRTRGWNPRRRPGPDHARARQRE